MTSHTKHGAPSGRASSRRLRTGGDLATNDRHDFPEDVDAREDSDVPGGDIADDVCILSLSDDNYVPHLATLLVSLARSGNRYPFYLLQTDLSEANRAALSAYARSLGIALHYIGPEGIDLGSFDHGGNWPVCNWMKFYIDRIVPERFRRVIFLDSDIVVTKPLGELAGMDLGGAALGAVVDKQDDNPRRKRNLGIPADGRYFNMGVFVADMPRWREVGMGERAAHFASTSPEKISFIDQCAFNASGWRDIAAIDQTWNQMVSYFAAGAELPHVIHYCGHKPWSEDFAPALRFYWHYRAMTPFAGADPGELLRAADRMTGRDRFLHGLASLLSAGAPPRRKRRVQRFNRIRYARWFAEMQDLEGASAGEGGG